MKTIKKLTYNSPETECIFCSFEGVIAASVRDCSEVTGEKFSDERLFDLD